MPVGSIATPPFYLIHFFLQKLQVRFLKYYFEMSLELQENK